MIRIPKIPEGSVEISDNYYLLPKEIEFFQLLADGATIGDAAVEVGIPKATCDRKILDLRDEFDLKTITHLIAFLLRKKIID